jgi:hypothetical protein
VRVELPALHGLRTFHRLAEVRQTRDNTPLFSQEAMNGARRAGQAQSGLLQALITSQIVQDRLGTWRASQSFRRLVANIQESIHDQRVEFRGWMVRSSREALQHLLILKGCTCEPFLPFVHPTQRHPGRLGKLSSRPAGMQLEQATQIPPCRVVYCFHDSQLLSFRKMGF